MPIDPQIEAMLAERPKSPGARLIPLGTFREAVRKSALALPLAPDAAVARIEDRRIDGPGGPLALRIYTPEGDGPFPVTVYMHGGGYVLGDLDTQDMIARAFCAWAETIVVSVDYRLAPEHPFPAAPDDSYAALVWTAEHAKELGGDPDRLALAGDSAGGNIACATAIRARDLGGPAVRAQVSIYGSGNYPSGDTVSARTFADGPILRQEDVEWFWHQYLSDPATQRHHPHASPSLAESHVGLPPAFFGTAEYDPTRDDGENFAEKLRAAGVTVEMKRYAGMVHGFASWVGLIPGGREVMQDASRFLKRHLAG